MSPRSRPARTVLALAVMLVALAAMVVLGDLRPGPAAFVALAFALAAGRAPSPSTSRC